jgi:ribosome-associated translation inhibitor RaiA
MLFEVHARGINLEGSNYSEVIEQAFDSTIQPYRRAIIKLSVVIERQSGEATPTYECRAAVDLFGRPSIQVEAQDADLEVVIDQTARKLLTSLAAIFEKP